MIYLYNDVHIVTYIYRYTHNAWTMMHKYGVLQRDVATGAQPRFRMVPPRNVM